MGVVLFSAAGIGFLFGAFLMLLAALVFFTGGVLEKFCNDLEQPDYILISSVRTSLSLSLSFFFLSLLSPSLLSFFFPVFSLNLRKLKIGRQEKEGREGIAKIACTLKCSFFLSLSLSSFHRLLIILPLIMESISCLSLYCRTVPFV